MEDCKINVINSLLNREDILLSVEFVRLFASADELARLDSITTTIAPESKFCIFVSTM